MTLDGPRPPPVVVKKNSSMIKKSKRRHDSPVVVYVKSPTIIHTSPHEFMGLVQRLTGKGGPSMLVSSSSFESREEYASEVDLGLSLMKG
ncbi:hypothetical protein Acr_12g0005470 [Actinidia rufa]|uniref:VQ domain-containing protein n=1 Tax=Actinidia rufa TaxID=165716 RepID=A0A7J0FHT4_9ERIC|nr:hypothetical protein Acr_12g0005470 [Actinidia rufa]